MKILEVKNISKKRKHKTIYSNISMNVEKGECYAVLGKDNEGKTSIINAILGFDKPDEGDIIIFGEKKYNIKSIRKRIGFVPDDLLCFEKMTGANLLDMTMRLRGSNDYLESAGALIDYFQINPALELQNMDDDMNKCTYIVNAFLAKPDIVILDEPFNFLNKNSKNRLKKLMRAYTNIGNTIIIVNDDYNGVADVCKRFSVIKEHKQLRQDETPNMYEDMQIIVADRIENEHIINKMREYALKNNCLVKVIKHDCVQTVMLFRGEVKKLNMLLRLMVCKNYEIRNVSVQAQIMEWYD